MFSRSILLTSTILALALVASANPVAKRQVPQVITSCTVPNTAAITFDDGPWVYLKNISDTLTAANATGTFFFNGNLNDCIYNAYEIEGIQYAFEQGHMVASHGWSHTKLANLTENQIHDELWRVEQALQRIVGVVPAFIRPPAGEDDEIIARVAAARGQKVVIWDLEPGDSTGSSPTESKRRYDEAIGKRPSNILVRNNQGYAATVHDVLPHAIRKLREAGYNMVSLAECLDLPPYQSVGPRGVPDRSWSCTGSY